jgi:DNA-binding transcriptional MerR regulator
MSIIQVEPHFKSRGTFMAHENLLAIGELARRTGLATSALRYYERAGLLPAPERVGQRRHYPQSSAQRVALIRLCQDAGFTLAEISDVLAAKKRGPQGWTDLAERKIAQLDARILDARRAKKMIRHAIECPHHDLLACPHFRSTLQRQLEHAQ